MFKSIKLLLLFSLYKRAKKTFMLLFFYTITLVIITLIMNDLINISTGVLIYILLLLKWISNLLLLSLIGLSILKIVKVATSPFENEKNASEVNLKNVNMNEKKAKIVGKDILRSNSDLILQKYMKNSK
jgi:hypothetical protein